MIKTFSLFCIVSLGLLTFQKTSLEAADETLEQKALREGHCLELGLNGELIVPPKDYGCGDLVVTNQDGSIIISYMYNDKTEGGRNRFAWRQFAVVNASGTLQVRDTQHFPQKGGLTELPEKWTFLNAAGKLVLPERERVLSRSNSRTRTKPAGSLGCYILLAIPAGAIAPSPEVEPPENIVWILPLELGSSVDKGFQLVHSGPLHDGVYLTVYPDRSVALGSGAVNVEQFIDKKLYWPHIDYDTGNIFVPIGGHRIGLLETQEESRSIWREGKPYSVSRPLTHESEEE